MSNCGMSPTTNVETQKYSLTLSKLANLSFAVITIVGGGVWWVRGIVQEINKAEAAIEERQETDKEQNIRLEKLEAFMEKANSSIIRQEVKLDQVHSMLKDALARKQ